MTPIDMTVAHDPPNSWGDCFRACVASLLDLPVESVPHFADGDVTREVELTRLTGFLRQQGMFPLALRLPADEANHWFDVFRGYYLLGGTSRRGTGHYVVAAGRAALAHDPHPTDKSGVVPEDGRWWDVILFCRLNECDVKAVKS